MLWWPHLSPGDGLLPGELNQPGEQGVLLRAGASYLDRRERTLMSSLLCQKCRLYYILLRAGATWSFLDRREQTEMLSLLCQEEQGCDVKYCTWNNIFQLT